MEKVKRLTEFFNAIKNDGRISITHIGLYASLLQYWHEQNYCEPLMVFSNQASKIAKISARTYLKCIKELCEYGYLKYSPSFKQNRASEIYL